MSEGHLRDKCGEEWGAGRDPRVFNRLFQFSRKSLETWFFWGRRVRDTCGTSAEKSQDRFKFF